MSVLVGGRTIKMGIRENKEAVKIDDWVSDLRGTLIGWQDATDETPPNYNEEAYRVVYSKHDDVGNSIVGRFIGKIVSIVGGFAFDAFGKTYAFEVSDKIYPKSGIEGFPNGMTVSGISREVGTPDKRVILKNDIVGNRPYMSQVGPGNDGIEKTKSELQETINDLRQQLDAEEGKTHELEQQVDRDKDSSGSSSRYGPEHYDEMNREGLEGEHYG
jgi:hypothetical protein